MTTIDKLPDDETGAALRRFAQEGSDLTRTMRIDFFVAVPSKAAGECVAADLRGSNFDTSLEYDEESNMWTCYCAQTLVPTYRTICGIESQLDSIALRYGGKVDGFGSFGNAEH